MSTAERLYEQLKNVESGTSGPYSRERCEQMAPLVDEINRLKKEKNAVILAHSYVHPEIIYGVGDFTGDSYQLSKDAKATQVGLIIFVAVRFMAETAKALNPDKEVRIPSRLSGCSLADCITGADVRRLKAQHPDFTFVCYINTSAEVKAESDCIVTSANAEKILKKIFQKNGRVIFIPDRFMGANLAKTLGKTPGKEIILWDGACEVHEKFDARAIALYRREYPGLVALAHAECPSAIIDAVDFMGGTGDMLRYIENTNAAANLLVTQCGFAELARIRFPEKNFIAMCRLCPYMKSITLESVLSALERQPSGLEVTVPPEIAAKARRSIEKMFELAEE